MSNSTMCRVKRRPIDRRHQAPAPPAHVLKRAIRRATWCLPGQLAPIDDTKEPQIPERQHPQTARDQYIVSDAARLAHQARVAARHQTFRDLETCRDIIRDIHNPGGQSLPGSPSLKPAPPQSRPGSFIHQPVRRRALTMVPTGHAEQIDKRNSRRARSLINPTMDGTAVGTVISKRDFQVLQRLFDSIDTDHSNDVTPEEYAENVAKMAPQLAPMAQDMFELISAGRARIDYLDFVCAAYPMLSRKRIEHQHIKHFPPSKQLVPARRSSYDRLDEDQKEELHAIVRGWDDDKDGSIDKSELEARCMSLDIEEAFVDSWFAEYGACGDDLNDPRKQSISCETAARMLAGAYHCKVRGASRGAHQRRAGIMIDPPPSSGLLLSPGERII